MSQPQPGATDRMLETAARKAELTGQIPLLLGWVGPGRKLTATGRVGLADARQLVELLGTGDTIDPEIGGRIFKTKSSEDLAHLNRIVEWAKAARLIRASGTKLIVVKKNAVLAGRPLDLVLALLEAYPRLGKPMFPRNTWRQSLVGDEFTDISQELITRLLRSAGPCSLDKLSDIAYHAIEARYMLTDLTTPQHDSLRRMIAADVTIAMAALHVLGVVVLDRETSSAMLTDLGRYAVRRIRGLAQPGDPVLQLRIALADVDDPPVWRQVVIPAGYTLDRVHDVIQAAMGWQNSHLHLFRIAGREYRPAYLDDELETLDEKQFRIGDLMTTGDLADYEYDFGDGWGHELAVGASSAADAATVYPECTGGEGACPPEDCGGPGGFADLKELLTGPPSPERDEMRAWAGEEYDPVHFDLAAANTAAGSV
jgi:Plasmid pRiA4b ORF-3-like protein